MICCRENIPVELNRHCDRCEGDGKQSRSALPTPYCFVAPGGARKDAIDSIRTKRALRACLSNRERNEK